jgi:hypothetical protein
MIKFFRHIRKSLLNEGKTSKYFKYAIGEIVLVVIGILIALQINNWNENNKNQKEVTFQLSKLRDNLISDKAQIEKLISMDSVHIENLVFCVKVLAAEKQVPIDEFKNSFQYMSYTITFSPIKGTFEGLVSSGKIELIRNQSLLENLFLYYNSDDYKNWDSSLKDYIRNVFMPHILNFDHMGNIEGLTQIDISKFSVPRKTINDYKNNLFLLNGLRTKILILEGQKRTYTELKSVIDPLIDSIENELNLVEN